MYCCPDLAYHITNRCVKHDNAFDCPDSVIVPTSQGYGLPIHDGGSSFIEINYCPWCGANLKSDD